MAARALPLAVAMVARGHQCELLLPPWSSPQDSGKSWDESGVSIHNIRLPHPLPLLAHVTITARLLLRIFRTRPDVVHCFKPKGYSGLVIWALHLLRRLGLTRPRLVLDADDWEGAGGWNDVGPYPRWQKRVFAWQEKWGYLHCDSLTVASLALQTIAWSLGAPSGRVHYVPNGASPHRISGSDPDGSLGCDMRQRHGLGSEPVLLLYSRLWDFDLSRVVRVFAHVQADVPDIRMLVVGAGLCGEERQLEQLVQESGLRSSVVMAGWVQRDELPGYFACADAALFPLDDTLINRTRCPAKLVDLLAAGVPVVAETVGQSAEYITDGETGLLVAPGDEMAFASAATRLLRSPSLRGSLSQAARERVSSSFAWELLAEQVEAIYASTCEPTSR